MSALSSGPVQVAEVIAPARWVVGAASDCYPKPRFEMPCPERICTELQMQLWQDVPYIPMGEYWQSTAYRKDLLDVLPGCFVVFYGVHRG